MKANEDNFIFNIFIFISFNQFVFNIYEYETFWSQSKTLDERNRNKVWHTMAITDSLTGIQNRNAYNQYISNLDIKKEKYGVLLFDIDDFKKINDTKGHLSGDAVLKSVAKILDSLFSSPEYTVYRIGGDEFAVISKNQTEKQIIEKMIDLKNILKKEGNIRLSSGYSMINKSVRTAFKYADEMLYADKASKKHQSLSNCREKTF